MPFIPPVNTRDYCNLPLSVPALQKDFAKLIHWSSGPMQTGIVL